VSLTPSQVNSSVRSASYIDQAELELYDTIGKGAFGVVFRGSWRGQEVAVKVLSLAFHEEAAHVRSFKKEVDVLSRVNHPHIVKLMGASLAPPDVCIVEELMPNGSLHDALHKRRWKPSYVEILTIVHDVAAALAYLHPRIVHCDLKPQNVLLTLEDRAKVADFGIAKIKRGTYIHGTTADVNGTPGYMAPELFSSGKVSEKCDVFSIGILLWVCYTGQEPWADFAFPMQVVMAVAVQHRRPEIPEDMPAPLVSLLHRCWKEEPHRRPSCAELQKQALLLIEEERMNPQYSTAPVLSSHPL
jgi:serine/threonine protein kinase